MRPGHTAGRLESRVERFDADIWYDVQSLKVQRKRKGSVLSQMARTDVSVQEEPAILAAVFNKADRPAYPQRRDPLEELGQLASTAGAVVVDELIQYLPKPVAATLMGKGKLEELAAIVKAREAKVVIFENNLSPSQIRNIEEVVMCKIVDRSELILDIFASRAQSHEAKLQVELAQLEYTYPRLRAMWDHLERIAGGSPAGIGTRGPGEQQIEIDRRIVQQRKSELKREIAKVHNRKRREVASRNIDFFTVGLVGYTNAGKSTLFNTITDAKVYADDKLFATLDTRTRKWELGGGDTVMLSDTVGFVRDLPHNLVASFKATLEESIHSDLLLIVLDVADEDAAQHFKVVRDVLEDIDAGDKPFALLLNKVDLLEDNAEVLVWQNDHPESLPISAANGVGIDSVIKLVRENMQGQTINATLRLPMSEGKAMSFLENRATIHDRDYDTTHVTLTLTIGSRVLDQLKATGAKFEIVD
jgi:GTP-binding protein HflX